MVKTQRELNTIIAALPHPAIIVKNGKSAATNKIARDVFVNMPYNRGLRSICDKPCTEILLDSAPLEMRFGLLYEGIHYKLKLTPLNNEMTLVEMIPDTTPSTESLTNLIEMLPINPSLRMHILKPTDPAFRQHNATQINIIEYANELQKRFAGFPLTVEKPIVPSLQAVFGADLWLLDLALYTLIDADNAATLSFTRTDDRMVFTVSSASLKQLELTDTITHILNGSRIAFCIDEAQTKYNVSISLPIFYPVTPAFYETMKIYTDNEYMLYVDETMRLFFG